MFMAKDYDEMEKIARGNKEREAVMGELKKLGSDPEFVDLYDHDEFIQIYVEDIKKSQREAGREEGAQERSVEIAKNLLNINMDLKTISNVTNLSIEEIKNIKES